MNIPKSVQNIIFVGVIVVIAFIAYSFFIAKEPEAVLSTGTATASGVSAPDQDLIALLLELKSITLDSSVFTSPAFASLQDFSQELIPEPVGRTNPFSPLDGSGKSGQSGQ